MNLKTIYTYHDTPLTRNTYSRYKKNNRTDKEFRAFKDYKNRGRYLEKDFENISSLTEEKQKEYWLRVKEYAEKLEALAKKKLYELIIKK